MKIKTFALMPFLLILACSCGNRNESGIDVLPVIKPASTSGFSNGGWNFDRYADLEPLAAGKSIVIADLQGPGIITHIHTTRHKPKELFARGIVLIIYFDDAPEPAVCCPLADFFGDGCNGNSMDFTSNMIECAPWSYNAYIPMPFRKNARVILRNDTEKNASNYSYVEWEKLLKWQNDFGYFHATYQRKAFQLDSTTNISFFKVQGQGHILGRQFSVATDEPIYRDKFTFIMEGNNEITIDGKERAFDYLGTEDSYTFSWGFRNVFAGLHAGMPLIEKGDTSYLSIYRFHDHMPIRFNRELEWRINWEYEFQNATEFRAKMKEALKNGGCNVDYATVFYWYQDKPGGYIHDPLPPVQERQIRFIKKVEGNSGKI